VASVQRIHLYNPLSSVRCDPSSRKGEKKKRELEKKGRAESSFQPGTPTFRPQRSKKEERNGFGEKERERGWRP